MSAVAMRIHAVRKSVSGPASDKLAAIEATVTSSLAETRRFVWDLREQPASDQLDLGVALDALATRLAGDQVGGCQVTVEGTAAPLAPPVADELLRIAGEALQNAFRHAEARHIEVRLCYEQAQVTLTVLDDGRGFDTLVSRPGHFGLQGLRERAARLGAVLRVDSRPGAGTRVEVTVPLVRRETAVG
jgi:signal transduction histidine kinase